MLRLADEHAVPPRVVYRHLEAIGFKPQPAEAQEVLDGLATIRQQIWCRDLGAVFADSRLRGLGIYARPALIRACLKLIDPVGAKARAPFPPSSSPPPGGAGGSGRVAHHCARAPGKRGGREGGGAARRYIMTTPSLSIA